MNFMSRGARRRQNCRPRLPHPTGYVSRLRGQATSLTNRRSGVCLRDLGLAVHLAINPAGTRAQNTSALIAVNPCRRTCFRRFRRAILRQRQPHQVPPRDAWNIPSGHRGGGTRHACRIFPLAQRFLGRSLELSAEGIARNSHDYRTARPQATEPRLAPLRSAFRTNRDKGRAKKSPRLSRDHVAASRASARDVPATGSFNVLREEPAIRCSARMTVSHAS